MGLVPIRLFLALMALFVLASPTVADWPHLRGPHYDGISTEKGLADTWPKEGPPLLWTRELGQGHSGFIVADGKLFTQRQSLGGQYLLCLDPDTGQTLWETRYDWAWQTKGAYPGPYASPTFYRGRIYYASPTGLVGCMDARTGSPLWFINVQEKYQGKGYGFGFASTPLVEEDRVILTAGGKGGSLVALHADDGREIWTAGSDPASYCPAYPITVQGKRCVVGYLENSLLIVELATGKVLFRQPLSHGYDEHSAWPLYDEPHLTLLAPFRAPAVRLRFRENPDRTLSATTEWISKELSNDVVSSVLYQGHIYGFDLRQPQSSKHRPSRGTFKCLDAATGKALWSTDQVGHAAMLAADGKLFLLNDSGDLILARADPARYQELGRVTLFEEEICWTPPTLYKGRLFVRSPSKAVCLYVGKAEGKPEGPTASLPSTRSWKLSGLWLLSHEREYPNDAFTMEEMGLWFAACLAILLAAGLITLVAGAFLSGGRKPPEGSPSPGAYVPRSVAVLFWGLVFVLGFLGPNVLSTWLERGLFTWPVSLYAAFHGMLKLSFWAGRNNARVSARWLARVGLLGFLLICYGYYELCKQVGMFIAWSFLFGFLPAFPLTYVAAAWERTPGRWGASVLLTLLGFTVFFWSCQILLLWKGGQL